MAKIASASTVPAVVVKQRLDNHPELTPYGDNALPLLGFALHLHADDMEELANEALTDGSNDKKIDFCYIDRTDQYAIVAQGYTSKDWSGRKEAPANKASDLISAVGWLLSGDMTKVPAKLRSVTSELRQAIQDNEINRLELLYIHNYQESTNVENELRTAAQVASDVIQNKSISVSYRELGLTELESLCLSSESEILVKDSFPIPGDNIIEESGKEWQSIVVSMPGDWLHHLHARHGTRLFSASAAPMLCAFHGDPQMAARRCHDIFNLDSLYNRVFPKACTGEHVLLVHCLGLAMEVASEKKLEKRLARVYDRHRGREVQRRMGLWAIGLPRFHGSSRSDTNIDCGLYNHLDTEENAAWSDRGQRSQREVPDRDQWCTRPPMS